MVNTYEVARAVDQSSRDYAILSFDAYLHCVCLPLWHEQLAVARSQEPRLPVAAVLGALTGCDR
jgi:hypothetical protein